MTNEEKAKELAGYCAGETDYKETAAYDAALAMAQWKDERIKELEVTLNCRSKYERIYRNEFLEAEKQALIDKACEWWEMEIIYPTMTQAEKEWFEARIEAFKKAMKGGNNE